MDKFTFFIAMGFVDKYIVGIGTSTPLDLLAINGAAAGTDGAQGLSVLYNATTWPRIRGGIFHGGNSSGPGGVGGLQIIAQGAHMSSAGSGSIHFLTPTGDSANGTTDAPVNTRMTILQNGNVGIGVTAPQAALDVVSTGTSSAVIVPRATTGNRPTTLVNGMIRYNTDRPGILLPLTILMIS
jgi:hypothetical protein